MNTNTQEYGTWDVLLLVFYHGIELVLVFGSNYCYFCWGTKSKLLGRCIFKRNVCTDLVNSDVPWHSEWHGYSMLSGKTLLYLRVKHSCLASSNVPLYWNVFVPVVSWWGQEKAYVKDHESKNTGLSIKWQFFLHVSALSPSLSGYWMFSLWSLHGFA